MHVTRKICKGMSIGHNVATDLRGWSGQAHLPAEQASNSTHHVLSGRVRAAPGARRIYE
jgi:hypothetical protein